MPQERGPRIAGGTPATWSRRWNGCRRACEPNCRKRNRSGRDKDGPPRVALRSRAAGVDGRWYCRRDRHRRRRALMVAPYPTGGSHSAGVRRSARAGHIVGCRAKVAQSSSLTQYLYIAVLARGQRGSGVWLHDLESGSARLLVENRLRYTAVLVARLFDGGLLQSRECRQRLDNRPTELVAAPGCVDGSWHATSGWLLSTDAGLVEVSPRWNVVPVTTVNTAHGELAHVFGRWLPDGVHLLLNPRRRRERGASTWVQSATRHPGAS